MVVGGPLDLSSELLPLMVENTTEWKTLENIEKMIMVTHNSHHG